MLLSLSCQVSEEIALHDYWSLNHLVDSGLLPLWVFNDLAHGKLLCCCQTPVFAYSPKTNASFHAAAASHPSSGYASVGALAPTRTDFAVMQWCTRTMLILLRSGIITISWSRLNLIGRSVALLMTNHYIKGKLCRWFVWGLAGFGSSTAPAACTFLPLKPLIFAGGLEGWAGLSAWNTLEQKVTSAVLVSLCPSSLQEP